ncbi:MAG TPA: NUDIX domain-containing protein [Pseudonocardiaceae bacterium]|nr:NUDIX domain-containing protein [Pseudonocardiaceae bacterium]
MTAESIASVLGALLALVLLFGPWLLGTATRLDRLHVRTDAAWAGLDASLARRAVVSRAVAAAGCLAPEPAEAVRAAATRAEAVERVDRETAESDLTRLLALLDRTALPPQLAEELADAEQRVVLARRVHNDAVRDTRALRRRRVVRWLKLAGTAPQPDYFEIAEPDVSGTPVSALTRRVSARIVLTDRAGRVLLFHGVDPGRPDASHWFTPGGGVEDGEELRATAVRELHEETGLRISPEQLTGPAWVRRPSFTFDGESYLGEEWFFLAAGIWTDHDQVDMSGFTELERSTMDSFRWWTLRELASTTDTVYPPALAELLPPLLAGNWDGRTRVIE